MPDLASPYDALLDSLRRLTDDELVARLKSLGARERRATALLVAHLAELDTRDVCLREGYSSLFTYCLDVLGLSEDEAYNRIEAARAARRFPAVLDLLSAGELSLTAVRLLGRHLTPENHLAVLESARRKRKAEVEQIVARLAPRPDIVASVRKLPERKQAPAAFASLESPVPLTPNARTVPGAPPTGAGPAGPAGGLDVGGTPAAASGATSPASPDAPSVAPHLVPPATSPLAPPAAPLASPAAPPLASPAAPLLAPATTLLTSLTARSAAVTALSPDRYKYQLTIGGSTLEKLRLAKDMLRHTIPSGDDEAILDRALTALLYDLVRKKFGAEREECSSGSGARTQERQTLSSGPGARAPSDPLEARAAPRAGRVEARDSRHVPASVKRVVWVRDLGRCAFVGTDGRRCGERAFLEFHHVRPHAVGGDATVRNIEPRCRRHNQYEERVFFQREPVRDVQLAGGCAPSQVSSTSDAHGALVPERATHANASQDGRAGGAPGGSTPVRCPGSRTSVHKSFQRFRSTNSAPHQLPARWLPEAVSGSSTSGLPGRPSCATDRFRHALDRLEGASSVPATAPSEGVGPSLPSKVM